MRSKLDAVLELAHLYDYDPLHSHQVECLAGTLFMELESLHKLSRDDRKLLEYAAILHDIGYYISAKGHQKHALQMIMMESLPEFTREEKTVIANIVRYHRKSLPEPEHTAYWLLSDTDRRRVDLLAPLLRIADALDRTHRKAVSELTCEVRDRTVLIHVVTEADLDVETAALARKADWFRQVYLREPQLCITRPQGRQARIGAAV